MSGLLYEIINPSDPVTIIAPSFEAAAISTLLLGNGAYGAKPVECEGEEVPIFLLGGLESWFERRWPGKTVDHDFARMLNEHRADVIATLRSACTGGAAARKLFDSALAAITDEDKRKAFLAEWDDQKRTSMNAIANRAHRIADNLAAKPEAA